MREEEALGINPRTLLMFVFVFSSAACGAMNTPGDLYRTEPALDATIDRPLSSVYRDTVSLARACSTSPGMGPLNNASTGINADFYDTDGFAEITAQISTPSWSMVAWALRLDRLSANQTRARVWTKGAAWQESGRLDERGKRTWLDTLSGKVRSCSQLARPDRYKQVENSTPQPTPSAGEK